MADQELLDSSSSAPLSGWTLRFGIGEEETQIPLTLRAFVSLDLDSADPLSGALWDAWREYGCCSAPGDGSKTGGKIYIDVAAVVAEGVSPGASEDWVALSGLCQKLQEKGVPLLMIYQK